MTIWESVPIIRNLISWAKTSKGGIPIVSVLVDIRQDHGGAIDLILVVATDMTIRKVSGLYIPTGSLPQCLKPPTSFQASAIYAGKPFEERILRVEVPEADEIWDRQAEITITIHLKYELETGETSKGRYDAILQRGWAQFAVRGSSVSSE